MASLSNIWVKLTTMSSREHFADVSACMMRLCVDVSEMLVRIADGGRIVPGRQNDHAVFLGECESGVVMARIHDCDDRAIIGYRRPIGALEGMLLG